jgi:hypothetical protein
LIYRHCLRVHTLENLIDVTKVDTLVVQIYSEEKLENHKHECCHSDAYCCAALASRILELILVHDFASTIAGVFFKDDVVYFLRDAQCSSLFNSAHVISTLFQFFSLFLFANLNKHFLETADPQVVSLDVPLVEVGVNGFEDLGEVVGYLPRQFNDSLACFICIADNLFVSQLLLKHVSKRLVVLVSIQFVNLQDEASSILVFEE